MLMRDIEMTKSIKGFSWLKYNRSVAFRGKKSIWYCCLNLNYPTYHHINRSLPSCWNDCWYKFVETQFKDSQFSCLFWFQKDLWIFPQNTVIWNLQLGGKVFKINLQTLNLLMKKCISEISVWRSRQWVIYPNMFH